jgi:2-dehydro-3-deoxyphosphogluconate aldolase/(4S)-4-hydroxy-2-oxoglutarate aldolase
MTKIVEVIKSNKIIPIIDLPTVKEVLLAVELLLTKKINTIELTLRTQEIAVQAAQALNRIFGNSLILGIGTVKSIQDFKLALDLGAQYVVSPGLTESLLKFSLNSHNIPYLPGAATASEIMLALEYGITHLKFFPAASYNGISMIKSFQGPFKEVSFCATGGINLTNKDEFLELDNVFAVGISKDFHQILS